MSRWWLLALAACGGGRFYAPCEGPEDCRVPEGADAECLDGSGGGFCTWACEVDADCADGPDDRFPLVCASFESAPGTHCFPSCDEAADDDQDACPPGYGCRSTGGGSDNRKVCFPE